MADLTDIVKTALTLDAHDRAALAEALLASLDDVSEEEAALLWADEARTRLEAYRGGRAHAVDAESVHEKVGRLFS